jgi:hypothetical protein
LLISDYRLLKNSGCYQKIREIPAEAVQAEAFIGVGIFSRMFCKEGIKIAVAVKIPLISTLKKTVIWAVCLP